MARPRTPVGAYGSIAVRRRGDRVIAETRIRDADGRLRHVRVTARSAAQARQVLKERLLDRPTFGSTRVLTPKSTFADLAEVWLADLAIQRLAEGTKQNYRDQVLLHVLPAFEHYTLAEITAGRVEWFLGVRSLRSAPNAPSIATRRRADPAGAGQPAVEAEEWSARSAYSWKPSAGVDVRTGVVGADGSPQAGWSPDTRRQRHAR